MIVRIEVLKRVGSMFKKPVESYEAPDGSWIQCETVGAQRLPAVTEVKEYETRRAGDIFLVRFTPINPPKIPNKLAKLLNGFDKTWGRNGHEYMGAHRVNAGGTMLNRVRELHAKWSWVSKAPEFPLKDDQEVTQFLNQDYGKLWK